ncbi:MAG: vWA domain-containing protein [Pseudomonadales bacterium]
MVFGGLRSASLRGAVSCRAMIPDAMFSQPALDRTVRGTRLRLPVARQHHFFGVLLLGCLCAIAAAPAHAASKPADVRVLIDISGSMLQSDPANLRRPALDLLVESLPPGSKAGVWTFGKYVNLLVPHAEVTPAWRRSARANAAKINSVAQRTNIGAVLEQANYDADARRFPKSRDYQRSVILLTDGKVDIARDARLNAAERKRVLEKILPAYQRAGVTVHSIALSGQPDAELMQALAEGSGGVFASASDAAELSRIFMRLLDLAAGSDTVPLSDNRFSIDAAVSEFSALVFKQPGAADAELTSPSGERLSSARARSGVRWLSHDSYDLVTIQSPESGTWRINAAFDPENRVAVVSDLKLQVDALSPLAFLGEARTLSLQVQDAKGPINDARFLSLLSVRARLFRNGVESWSGEVPADTSNVATFALALDMLDQPGDYQLAVAVDGKTFQRHRELSFSLRPPFRSELQVDTENRNISLTVVAEHERYNDDPSLRVHASVIDARDELALLELTPLASGVWSYQGEPGISGALQLTSFVTGSTLPGNGLAVATHSFDVNPQPSLVEPTATKELAPEPVAEAAHEPLVKEQTAAAPAAQVAAAGSVAVAVEPTANTPEPVAPETSDADTHAVAEQGGGNWIVYVALAVGNVLMLGALALVYRKIAAPLTSADTEEAITKGENTTSNDEAAAAGVAAEAVVAGAEPATEADQQAGVKVAAELATTQGEDDKSGQAAPVDGVAAPVQENASASDDDLDIEANIAAQGEAAAVAIDAADEIDDAQNAEVFLAADSGAAAATETDKQRAKEQPDDLDAALDEAIAAANERRTAGQATDDADDDVIIDLDGEFDLSSDISEADDESPPRSGAA